MNSSSDDLRHMMDESSARFHPKRGRMPRGLLQPERHGRVTMEISRRLSVRSTGDSLLRPIVHNMKVFPTNLSVT
ncbi:unnamed protein product [Protopolystoma xenopodis]|uniref:Uncharacterized protein n=1 Tax=Protopolystoma xenopodis TaxID=117903 RepID=A0A3S4ZZE7_9PLAT|nr:unnamed protein product [Protopolystoma xenopodis]